MEVVPPRETKTGRRGARSPTGAEWGIGLLRTGLLRPTRSGDTEE